MKLKKVISIISSFAIASTILASFASISYAATEDMHATITLDAVLDDGYYYIDVLLGIDNAGFSKEKVGRDNYFTGIGVYNYEIFMSNLTTTDIYDSAPIAVDTQDAQIALLNTSSSFTGGGFKFGAQSSGTVAALGATTSPTTRIARISTNYGDGDITEEALIEKFSDFGQTTIGIVSVDNTIGSTQLSNSDVTYYGVGNDGQTKYIDAHYAITMPGATPTTYTVTFVDWDGSTLKSETVAENGAATAPANPTREGYTFTGWDVDFDNITANTTVTAQYTQNTPEPSATVGTVVKGHDMYGQNTAVTKLSSIANALNPFVRITLGLDHKDYDLPAGVKGGSANIIAILRYAKGITGTFNIAVMDGDTVVASQDYVAN